MKSVSRRSRLFHVLFLAVLSLIAYFPSLNNSYSFDDYNWLERAAFAKSASAFVLEPEPGELYAPVAKLWFYSLSGVGNMRPLVFRLPLLLVHALNAVVVYALVIALSGSAAAALLAGALFASNAVFHEAIFWIAAFFHPLNTLFSLLSLLFFVYFRKSGNRLFLLPALFFFTLGLMTKGASFPVIAMLSILLFPATTPVPLQSMTPKRALVAISPFLFVFSVVLLFSLRGPLSSSYLIQRGIYRPGVHVLTNLVLYTGKAFFPFELLTGKIFSAASYQLLVFVFGSALVLTFIVLLVLSTHATRFFIVAFFLSLSPFLFFVYDPTSRYLYFASAFAAALLAFFAQWLLRRGFSRQLLVVCVSGFILADIVEIVGRDWGYEKREAQMTVLASDVVNLYPALPESKRITIYSFPKITPDRCIHFEAALRLHYRSAALSIICPEERGNNTSPLDADALFYANGRVVREKKQFTR